MLEAGEAHGVNPLEISFVETVEVIKLAAPRFEAASRRRCAFLLDQLLEDIVHCRNKRSRRPRSNPREVNVKMSNSKLKRNRGRGKMVDFEAALTVEQPPSPRKWVFSLMGFSPSSPPGERPPPTSLTPRTPDSGLSLSAVTPTGSLFHTHTTSVGLWFFVVADSRSHGPREVSNYH